MKLDFLRKIAQMFRWTNSLALVNSWRQISPFQRDAETVFSVEQQDSTPFNIWQTKQRQGRKVFLLHVRKHLSGAVRKWNGLQKLPGGENWLKTIPSGETTKESTRLSANSDIKPKRTSSDEVKKLVCSLLFDAKQNLCQNKTVNCQNEGRLENVDWEWALSSNSVKIVTYTWCKKKWLLYIWFGTPCLNHENGQGNGKNQCPKVD